MKKTILVLAMLAVYPISKATIGKERKETQEDFNKKFEAEYYKEVTRLHIEELKGTKYNLSKPKYP